MDDSEKWKGDGEELRPASGLFGGLWPTAAQVEQMKQQRAAAAMLAEVAYPSMPRYDEAEPCVKCGAAEHKVRYQRPGYHVEAFGASGEGFSVTCRRCRYIWHRRCIDAPEAA